jgi:hypothetical protein
MSCDLNIKSQMLISGIHEPSGRGHNSMSRKSKRRRADSEPSLENLEIAVSGLDLKFSRNLITVMDAYRINRTYSTEFVDKKINEGELPRSFVQQWGTIRSALHKLAALGPKVPNVEKWLNQRQYVSFASMAMLTIAVPVLVITWVLQLAWLQPFAIPLSVLAIALLLISWLSSAWFNRKVAWAIHDYVEANPALVGAEQKALKRWTQSLIFHAAREMRREGIDPEKNLVKFFNCDYKGIEVIKEPGGFRKHYVVKILTKGT